MKGLTGLQANKMCRFNSHFSQLYKSMANTWYSREELAGERQRPKVGALVSNQELFLKNRWHCQEEHGTGDAVLWSKKKLIFFLLITGLQFLTDAKRGYFGYYENTLLILAKLANLKMMLYLMMPLLGYSSPFLPNIYNGFDFQPAIPLCLHHCCY